MQNSKLRPMESKSCYVFSRIPKNQEKHRSPLMFYFGWSESQLPGAGLPRAQPGSSSPFGIQQIDHDRVYVSQLNWWFAKSK